MGFAAYPFFTENIHLLGWEKIIELADQALYYIKQHGRNGWAGLQRNETTAVSGDLVTLTKHRLEQEIPQGNISLDRG